MTYPINLPRFPPDPEEWLPGDLSKGEPPLPRWLFRGNYREKSIEVENEVKKASILEEAARAATEAIR